METLNYLCLPQNIPVAESFKSELQKREWLEDPKGLQASAMPVCTALAGGSVRQPMGVIKGENTEFQMHHSL